MKVTIEIFNKITSSFFQKLNKNRPIISRTHQEGKGEKLNQ